MEWREQGILLAVRRHGESAAIIEVFTPTHGRHAGIVRGGGSRRMAPVLQPGAQLDVAWRARLDAHLGTFQVEPVRDRAAALMADRLALAGLNALTAALSFCLGERDPHPRFYAHSLKMFDVLGTDPDWPLHYLHWELALLEVMGFGLDLSACAVTGARTGLRFVSPKSGRAVSEQGAGDWAGRLLPLPACLAGDAAANLSELIDGLTTTGYFLEQKVAPELGSRPFPPARRRLVDALARQSRR